MDMDTAERKGDKSAVAAAVGSKDRKEKEGEETSTVVIPNLPTDVVSDILKRISAEKLCSSLRYVCKPWFQTITNDHAFQQQHLRHHHLSSKDPPTILVHKSNMNKCCLEHQLNQTTALIKLGHEGQEEGLEAVDLTPTFQGLEIWNCCNGLILVRHLGLCTRYFSQVNHNLPLYVINPVTKQRARLPSCNCKFSDCNHGQARFVFLPSTQQYKVVRVVVGDVDSKSLLLPPYRRSCSMYLEVLTFSAGADSSSSCHEDFQWRMIEAPDLHRSVKPLPINGFVHFAEHRMGEAVSFDALDEKFYTTHIPDYDHRIHYHDKNDYDPEKHVEHEDHYRHECFLEMGGYLAYMRIRAHNYYPPRTSPLPPLQSEENQPQPQYQLDVWTLNDVEKGEWVQQYTSVIDSTFVAYDPRYYGYPRYRFKGYHRVGETAVLSCGENGETIFFIGWSKNDVRVCNVKTNQYWKLPNAEEDYYRFIGYHFNTLSSFNSPISN